MTQNEDGQLELKKFQLEKAYDGARAVHESSVKFITITGAVAATLLTVGIERKSGLIISLVGLVILFLMSQLNEAGKRFAAALLAALSLEDDLKIKPHQSIVRPFLKKREIKYMREDLKQAVEAKDEWYALDSPPNLKRYQPTSLRGFGTCLAVIVGILLLFGGLYLEFSGWRSGSETAASEAQPSGGAMQTP
jgi:hypothetical protein